ncbi:hypothetical protein APS_0741 [Acetobacter pasteurianus subsp. pasteurianus LMG 1262 = NBRC 106471]|nr:hypothetical protein APS_0741 [Acetobacter pasteurianus subsp. pasteurianus LMG 1262 = NBRC 106471]
MGLLGDCRSSVPRHGLQHRNQVAFQCRPFTRPQRGQTSFFRAYHRFLAAEGCACRAGAYGFVSFVKTGFSNF